MKDQKKSRIELICILINTACNVITLIVLLLR